MKFITQVFSIDDFNKLHPLGFDGFILCHRLLSRFGTLSSKQVRDIICRAGKLNIKMYLQTDLIVTEGHFKKYMECFSSLPLEKIEAVRTQDIGVANYFKKNFKSNIHLILENGNRNIRSILGIYEYFKNTCSRMVLPFEIPGSEIRKWIKQIPVETEILGLGPIPVFYSRRKLLTPVIKADFASATTSDIRNKGEYPVLENKHGTFMFHSKDICLLNYVPELERAGLSAMRIDRYFNPHLHASPEKIKSIWKNALIHGFYKANRTQISFKNFKNEAREIRNKNLVAEVLESEKGKYIVLLLHSQIKKGDSVYFITPKGEKIEFNMEYIKSASGIEKDIVNRDEICLIPHIDKVTSRSYLYVERTS
jgi:U32 family peptidase